MSVNPRKNTSFFILCFFIVATLGLYIFVRQAYPSHLVINEISFSNNNKNDWLEIYNPSLNSLSLKGYFLSDTAKKYTRFLIDSDIVVPGHGFVVFYGKKHDADDTLPVSLNFNITNGETIYLTDPSGIDVIDFVTAVSNKDTGKGFSIGRFPDGASDIFILSESTMKKQNIRQPEVSEKSDARS